MKFATLRIAGEAVVAAVWPEANRYLPIRQVAGRPVASMFDLVANAAEIAGLDANGAQDGLDGIEVDIPIRPRRNIMCVGKNYREHAHEFVQSGFDGTAASLSDPVPTHPIVFTKAPETLLANGGTIRFPSGLSDCIDYEAELAVVIGKGGRGIARTDALDHVFGYVIVNDVTARDLQLRHKQWFIGKSLDTFCPIGSWIATRDEIDLADTRVSCRVNGELRQDANTADMIFDVPAIIETLSKGMTLQPGDVIATGTPAGVGVGFDPPRYLRPGDEVAIEIAGLGRLVNRMA